MVGTGDGLYGKPPNTCTPAHVVAVEQARQATPPTVSAGPPELIRIGACAGATGTDCTVLAADQLPAASRANAVK
jgi:hypothetical protein